MAAREVAVVTPDKDAPAQEVAVIDIPADKPAVQAPGSPSKLDNLPRIGVTWKDVSFEVKIKNPETKQLETKQILKSVSGEALPGELVVLMGPSGAGKSSLLDCISARNTSCTGSILVNGTAWNKTISKHSCYVMQDDLFYANLTVLEHLTFQAQLRMGKDSTDKDRKRRVNAVISELGLSKCINTPIGGEMVKGISGGQRKRLSFATELLTNPSMLFVDEPTSGLDSFMAETVVLQMRDLARKGRTIIATIHQPSSELFALFDRLYLLADGCTVYDGNASDSIKYFASVGHQCPAFMNPTDYFMKLLVVLDEIPEAKPRVEKLVEDWKKHEVAIDKKMRQETIQGLDTTGEAFEGHLGFFSTVGVLCKRNWLRLTRDDVAFKARIGSSLFISVMVGLIFLQLDLDMKGIQDFTGAIFFISVNQVFSSSNPEFITIPLEVPIVLREHAGGLYHALTWYAAKNLSELPFQLIFPMCFLVPCYFMVGFGANATVFFTFYMFIALLSSCATGLGYMVSCMAKRVDIAPIIGILFILPFLLFGGLFLNSDSTPSYFTWLQQISPIKYGFHGIMRAFWTPVGHIECKAGQVCYAATGDKVLEMNSIDPDTMWVDIVVLIALNIAFRLLGAFFLWRRIEKKKI